MKPFGHMQPHAPQSSPLGAQGLRIAVFSGNYNYVRDGANQALNKLVAYLEAQGAAVRVYSPTSDNPAFEPAGTLVPVPSISIPRRREYRLALGLPKEIRRDIIDFKPNIIHLAAPDILGYRALKLAHELHIPAVASVHTRFETYLKYYGLSILEPLAKRYLRHFYNECSQVYAPSACMAQILRGEDIVSDIRLWSRGIDHRMFAPAQRSPEWRRALGIGDDEVAILFVGRVVLEKGLESFAGALERLRARRVPHRALVVGDGPARPWFEKHLPGAIFTGFLSGADLARAYASADIFLNPSCTETFGNVTLEAMASGLPVVGARATGNNSLIQQGETGFLVPPEDTGGYADALAKLIEDAGLRRKMGRASREYSYKHSWDSIMNMVLAHYRAALGDASLTQPAGNADKIDPAGPLKIAG